MNGESSSILTYLGHQADLCRAKLRTRENKRDRYMPYVGSDTYRKIGYCEGRIREISIVMKELGKSLR